MATSICHYTAVYLHTLNYNMLIGLYCSTVNGIYRIRFSTLTTTTYNYVQHHHMLATNIKTKIKTTMDYLTCYQQQSLKMSMFTTCWFSFFANCCVSFSLNIRSCAYFNLLVVWFIVAMLKDLMLQNTGWLLVRYF